MRHLELPRPSPPFVDQLLPFKLKFQIRKRVAVILCEHLPHYKTISLIISLIISSELIMEYQPDYQLNYQPDYQPDSSEVSA